MTRFEFGGYYLHPSAIPNSNLHPIVIPYMDSTCLATWLCKKLRCERIYGFSMRKLSSNLRCFRSSRPHRACSILCADGMNRFSGGWSYLLQWHRYRTSFILMNWTLLFYSITGWYSDPCFSIAQAVRTVLFTSAIQALFTPARWTNLMSHACFCVFGSAGNREITDSAPIYSVDRRE